MTTLHCSGHGPTGHSPHEALLEKFGPLNHPSAAYRNYKQKVCIEGTRLRARWTEAQKRGPQPTGAPPPPKLMDWNGWEADPFPPRVGEGERLGSRTNKLNLPGYVYLKRYALPMIDGLILVETGSTAIPKGRISKLPCRAKWSAKTLEGRVTAERAFQALFDEHRLARNGSGRECFLVPPDVLDEMVKALRQI